MAYVLKGRKGATVRFVPAQNGLVEKESESYTSTVTSNPVEDGSDINDHVNNEAGTLSISGTIIGGGSAITALKAMRESRDILTYTGKTRVKNLVFTNLKFDYDYKNRDGASFSATLKQIKTNTTEPDTDSETMTSQDSGSFSDPQLAKTSGIGLIVVSIQSVSSASAEQLQAAYPTGCSAAPLSRQTGSYDGLAAY